MANRLAGETSPYLLQHKDNPVDWYPWGAEALERARDGERPILLSIGYSACHWCHVMERESFEDAATARYMNEHFVCVKVDREERPDLDAIYMEAVQALTGRGGWPLTAFLTPEQAPFYAGTYFPPTARQGMPSFRQVLGAIAEAWERRRDEVTESAAAITERLASSARLRAGDDPLTAVTLSDAYATIASAYDSEHGGFGGPPKFPQTSAIELLLRGGEREVAMAIHTLRAITRGGIHDQIGGGFARYAVDREWLTPHFEKMLYDNALLARAYLHAGLTTGDAELLGACTTTLDWMACEMRGAEGGFYAALDADTEGVEGKFYVWGLDELNELLGADAPAMARYWGATAAGNFEGANILHVVAPDGTPDAATLERVRAALYKARAKRVPPGLDDKRLTAWNALAIAAFADAGAALGRADYIATATGCAEFVLGELRAGDGRLLRTWKDGQARLAGYLEDHAYMTAALLTLYEATFDTRWFVAARELGDLTIEHFADQEHGGFFSTADDHDPLPVRRKDLEDSPIPSGNAMIADALLRLAALTGEARYEDHAVSVLRLLQPLAARYPTSFGHLLQALDFHLGGARELALVGPDVTALATVARARPLPHLVIAGEITPSRWTAGDGSIDEGHPVPLLRRRAPINGRAAAYLCENFACRTPITDADTLRRELDGARSSVG